MKIALTGDVMLGRLVDQCVVQNRSVRPEALRSDVLPLMLSADCRLINPECAKWHPITKAFHFRALPRALEGSFSIPPEISSTTTWSIKMNATISPSCSCWRWRRIEDLGVRRANENEWQFLTQTMQAKCHAFGTVMTVEGPLAMINVG